MNPSVDFAHRFIVTNLYSVIRVEIVPAFEGDANTGDNQVTRAFIDSCNSLVANAGDDQFSKMGTTVTLDASNSIGQIPTNGYLWRVVTAPQGSQYEFTTTDTSTTTFTPDTVGRYEIELTVTDGITTAWDTVVVYVYDITYTPALASGWTNENVLSTITLPTGVNVTSEGGATHTFTLNGSWDYLLTVINGEETITQSVTANVTWIDKTPPVVFAGEDTHANKEVCIPATATDDNIIASVIWSKVSGPGTVTFNPTDKANTCVTVSIDGEYELQLSATDGAKNTASGTVLLYWDTNAPTATLVKAPQNPTNRTEETLQVTGAGVVNYEYKMNGVQLTVYLEYPVSEDIFLTGLTEGEHTLYLRGGDSAGNWQTFENATTYTWTVDLTPPYITIDPITSPTNQAIQEITGTVNDPLATVYVNGNKANITDNTWTYSFHMTKDGVNTITATATDLATNTSQPVVQEIVLDTQAPQTTIAPIAGEYDTPQTVSFTCDDGSGTGCVSTHYSTDEGATYTVYKEPLTIYTDTTFRVKSKDAVGNEETPVQAVFTIKQRALSGTVLDTNSIGIPGVTVTVTSDTLGQGFTSTTVTDQNGLFLLKLPPVSDYLLSIEAEGITKTYHTETSTQGTQDSAESTLIDLSAASKRDVIFEIATTSDRAISGTIQNDQGEPLAGIAVSVQSSSAEVKEETTTDANGQYTFTVQPAQDYRVFTSDQRYPTIYYPDGHNWKEAEYIDARFKNRTGINITLASGHTITGKVTVDGQPPGKGYTVTAWSVTKIGLGITAVNPDDGTYTLYNRPDRPDYMVMLSNGTVTCFYAGAVTNHQGAPSTCEPAYASATRLLVSGQDVTGIDFTLGKSGGVISGTVSMPELQDQTTLFIIIQSRITNHSVYTTAVVPAGETGISYRVTGLMPASDYTVAVIPDKATGLLPHVYTGSRNGANDASSTDKDRATPLDPKFITGGIDIVLSSGSTLKGTVTVPGESTEFSDLEVNLTATSYSSSLFSSTRVTILAGTTFAQYTLSQVKGDEEYRVSAEYHGQPTQYYTGSEDGATDASSHKYAMATPVTPDTVPDGAGIDITFPRDNKVTGIVTLPQPASGSVIVLVEARSIQKQIHLKLPIAFEPGDISREYTLHLPDANDYHITAGSSLFISTEHNPVDTTNGNVSGIDFDMTGGGEIRGRVTADNQGVPKVTILASNGSDADMYAVTDRNGEYTMSGLKAGSYSVTVYPLSQGYPVTVIEAVQVTVGSITEHVDVQLTAGVTIYGTVNTPTGPASRGRVHGYDPSTGKQFEAIILSDGTYTLAGLTGNTNYKVTPDSDGFTAKETVITTPGTGNLPDQDLTLISGVAVTGRITGAGYDPATHTGFLTVYKDKDAGIFVEKVQIRTNGTYTTRVLDVGSYFLQPEVRGYVSNGTTIEITSADITSGGPKAASIGVTKSSGSEIGGTVTINSTAGVDHINVFAWNQTTSKYADPVRIPAAGGSFNIKNLDQGSYTIVAVAATADETTISSSRHNGGFSPQDITPGTDTVSVTVFNEAIKGDKR